MTTLNVVTMYELQDLVTRCFEELEKAGFIKEYETAAAPGVPEPAAEHATGYRLKAIVDMKQCVDHIANTIIGEIHEFEMIRKLAAIFREMHRLDRSFQMIDEREMRSKNLAGLRIAPEG